MPTVNSVLGPLDANDLGFTLTHEHIFTASAGIQQTYPELFGDFQKLTEQVVLTLNEAREGGVRTIVDLSTLDLGRNVRFMAEMATRTGVQIICATGIWRDVPRALWLPALMRSRRCSCARSRSASKGPASRPASSRSRTTPRA
jgi:phosphotriesterase-related protein